MFQFNDPLFFLALIAVAVVTALSYLRKTSPRLVYSRLNVFDFRPLSWRIIARKALPAFRGISLCLFTIALARPQWGTEHTVTPTSGIDILLAIDVSGSMQAEDFKMGGRRLNRLEVVKHVVQDFIKERRTDPIGMIVFAGRPYTACPLTLDYGLLLMRIQEARIGMIEDRTAIGSAIATGVRRLEARETKSKIMILLTDGNNNAGNVDPLTAAEAAKALDVKIYCIGVGSADPPRPIFGRRAPALDEGTLKNIADRTGGKFYLAKDSEQLREIYAEINELEKTEIKVEKYMNFKELFPIFALLGLAFLGFGEIVRWSLVQQVP